MAKKPALLCTADGRTYRGVSYGADGVAVGEAVFNTSMTGYQEVFTDPSYRGQVVVMTSPHIGNYGVNSEDEQSVKPWLAGVVAKSIARTPSSWRSAGDLDSYLKGEGVVTIGSVDTRALTRHLRDVGSIPVAIGSEVDERDLLELAGNAPSMDGQDLVTGVSTPSTYDVEAVGYSRGLVVAMDLGIKRDIVSQIAGRGFDVSVVPASTSSDVILGMKPNGVFLSNGPGDPEPLVGIVETVRELVGKAPIFGICLGHQVLGLALGARTYKLKFGHHGGNHPVRRFADHKVEITAHNHGFAVDLWTLADSDPPEPDSSIETLLPSRVSSDFGDIEPTHQNLNDGTLEGMRLLGANLFSVQYHPEAAPGPNDSEALFDDFTDMMERAS